MGLFLAVTLLVTVVLSALAYAFGFQLGERGERQRERLRARLGWGPAPEPDGRPIEAIVADLRRLGERFHSLEPHTSYARVEAVRGAYDRTLAECCSALGIAHRLGVLPAGPELDAERERVEGQLTDCDVLFPHVA